jgi:hypothetical protein
MLLRGHVYDLCSHITLDFPAGQCHVAGVDDGIPVPAARHMLGSGVRLLWPLGVLHA